MSGRLVKYKVFLFRSMKTSFLNAFEDVINQFVIARVAITYYFVKTLNTSVPPAIMIV